MNIQQLKDWSARTRVDLVTLQSELGNPDNLFVAKSLAQDILNNLDELDKLLAAQNKTNDGGSDGGL